MSTAIRLLLALLLLCPVGALWADVVRYPLPESEGDQRLEYPRQLLELALSKVDTPYRIEFPSTRMNQERQALELEVGRTLDVAPIPSSADREARLLPIRIPLNKGLLGWRIGLVRKGEENLLAQAKTMGDLHKVHIVQGHEWPDTTILRSNGIEVLTGPDYNGLFKMLGAGRFDYFPRSVMEIWSELDANPGLALEPHVALHYFYDSYFFVNKKNTTLARDIEHGLEKAIADGSFERLFQRTWGDALRRARLDERTVIEMRNPLLTPETPSGRAELWYRQPATR
jgi:hypothetical protein